MAHAEEGIVGELGGEGEVELFRTAVEGIVATIAPGWDAVDEGRVVVEDAGGPVDFLFDLFSLLGEIVDPDPAWGQLVLLLLVWYLPRLSNLSA